MLSTKKKTIQKELRDSEALNLCAKQCGIIGDLTKLKICYLLRHYPELQVTDIANLVGSSISNVSHSLAKLKVAGMVCARRQGKSVFYALETDAFSNVLTFIGK